MGGDQEEDGLENDLEAVQAAKARTDAMTGMDDLGKVADEMTKSALDEAGDVSASATAARREAFTARRRIGIEMSHAALSERVPGDHRGADFGGMERGDMEALTFPHHERSPEEGSRRIAGHAASSNELMTAIVRHFQVQDQMLLDHERQIRMLTQALQRGRY